MEDALATSLQNWKFDFGDFASSIQADFSRLLVRQVTAPVYQSIIDSIPVLSQPAAVAQAAPQSGGQVFAKQSAPGGGNIYVSISTPDAQSFRASQRQVERQLAAALQKAKS